MREHWEAIRERVCRHCVDASAEGDCRIDADMCTLDDRYPEIVKVICTTTSESYDDYVTALRTAICSNCESGGIEACEVRTAVDCPLDRYFPLIIRAVEEIGIDKMREDYRGLVQIELAQAQPPIAR